MPVLNISNDSVLYEMGHVVARAVTCTAEKEPENFNCLAVNQNPINYFTMTDLNDRIENNLDCDNKVKLLDLINKYRNCFAINLNEVGRTDVAEISIKLTDDILIPSKDIDTGLESLENVLKLLCDAHMTLRFHKCNFLQEKLM